MVPAPTLDISNPVVLVGLLVVGLASISAFVRNLTAIWRDTRRQPSADETFATKEEVEAIKADLEKDLTDQERRLTADLANNRQNNERCFAELRTLVEGLRATVQSLSGDLNRAVGRLEGASSALHNAAAKIAHDAKS